MTSSLSRTPGRTPDAISFAIATAGLLFVADSAPRPAELLPAGSNLLTAEMF